MEDAGDIWMRERARRKGESIPQATKVECTISAKSATEANFSFTERLARSEYADAFKFELDDNQRKQKIAAFTAAPDSPHGAYELALALASIPFGQLADFAQKDLFPAFFGSYPDGQVIFITTDYRFEKRNGAIRAGYVAAQVGDLTTAGLTLGFDALSAWQPLSTLVQPRNLLDIGCYAFFPTIQWITLARAGLLILLVPGEKIQHAPPNFPGGWMDFVRSHWDFSEERLASPYGTTGVSGIAGSYAALRRLIHSPGWSVAEVEAFVRWLIERYNWQSFCQTDPTEFVTRNIPANARPVVDFIACFEHALTTDRVMRKALSCISSEETAVRKAAGNGNRRHH
jgi:hypothetical protein